VPLKLFWQEYQTTTFDSHTHTQFCHYYYQWRKDKKVSMRMDHKAGDQRFVDIIGKIRSISDPKTGKIIHYSTAYYAVSYILGLIWIS